MDGECAFCGRLQAASVQVFCEDCQVRHQVCQTCADEATNEAAAHAQVG